MASGLSMPIGFKNATDGNIDIAINAIQAAQHGHAFIGVTQKMAQLLEWHQKEMKNAHLIIRGGSSGPNYSSVQMEEHIEKIEQSSISTRILVDCSHGNSRKKAETNIKSLIV